MNQELLNLKRRSLIKLLAGASLVPFIGGIGKISAAENRIIKTIPSTGEKLPAIGLGTSRTFDVSPNSEVMARLGEVLTSFFQRGGSLVDSSPMYGDSEEVVGKLLSRMARPEALFAATKVWTTGRQPGIDQILNSQHLWGLPRFDLLQIHNLVDWETHLETLLSWKAEGRVRYIGITTSHGRYHQQLENILSRHPFDFVQLSYSLGEREVEQRLLPLAKERGIAVIANRPYQRGALFRTVRGKTLPTWAAEIDCHSWGQFFLKFVISHPGVTCAIPATSKPHHMADNMGALVGRLPDGEMRQRMLDTVMA